MDHLSVQNYPENARIPIRGPFYDLAQKEVFFPVNIDGYRNIYRVSNYGRVMSARDITSTKAGKILSPKVDRQGYHKIGLNRGGVVKHWSVHRLVLITFVGDPPTESHQVAHNDGVSGNNNVFNLRWATPRENQHDRRGHGTMLYGEDHGKSKLTEAQVLYAHEAYESGKSQREISEELGVDKTTISGILRGKSWGHLGLETDTRGVRPNSVTDEQIRILFELRRQGFTHQHIANTIGCSRTHVGDIINGKRRSSIQE